MTQASTRASLAPVIGLEVHVQLETETKIFCGCSTDVEDTEPNTNTCPVCLGLPGSLPVLNEASVEAAVKLGKAIEANIPERTRFHRKNYFYPDLPKGFQITQYDAPICADGHLEISHEGERRDIGIERAHLEEDPGSLQHEGGHIDTADYTLVDYNRAGVPLMEIVTKPDFRTAGEVRDFLTKLEEVLEYLGIYDSQRDGSLRIDANISLVAESEIGPAGSISDVVLADANRTEVKNISSHKGAETALAYEITRQRNAIERGREVTQETRHWDETRGITVSMREKEAEKEYRYFREADIPPLEVADWKAEIPIPELPDARRERFQTEYGLGDEAAAKLTSTKQVADFFEAVADRFDPDLAASWVADTLLGELNYRDMAITDVEGRFDEISRLIELVAEEEITERNAREVVLRSMLDEGHTPDDVVEAEDLGKSGADEIATAVEEAIENNPEAVDDVLAGEEGAINFLVGQVMQETGGRADPGDVNELLREHLPETN
ncbi:Asp-tRNA(Asn)/Glu-tRNA(Gln) amidotransferase subunit GatB [Halodesulfurarchaeum sp.]|uniref:Asp-tRNA(Asn)/Glu-tRNA(Gln) amidotransferase subunit GatB n=1 Tax=Halodesulfurarchaeum sp. TaxID=1980530 RepID=UPI001BC3242A|nr:Asp-tRNA(Asn)/Glu-tRNA(Gln) amidotransferase subunit GatB [Halodesulfurarchaeum sp.]